MFDFKEAVPISWVGQNMMNKSVIKPIYIASIYKKVV